MNLETIRNHCIKKAGVTEEFPFDETTLVFKVMGKMFCLTNVEPPLTINVKCEPEIAIELREHYDYVLPGYHMNKKHWNTIDLEGIVKDGLVLSWIDDSYNLVIDSLPNKKKKELNML